MQWKARKEENVKHLLREAYDNAEREKEAEC
jgi:hypothetical protein